jgi:hypothetical protein
MKEEIAPVIGDQFNRGRALVVGVANYAHAQTLPETVLNDARDVGALLRARDRCAYPPDKVEVLLDDQATAEGIRAGLRRLALAARPEETVFMFFSGHGGRLESEPSRGTYLLPFDCEPKRLERTAISATELTGLLSQINASRIVFFIDACHSASAGEVKALDPADGLKSGIDEKTYDKLAHGSGRTIMASSRATEVSVALPGMKNGLFTHYLLEALEGSAHTRGDGVVRVLDVCRYVSDKVQTKAAQHPIFKTQDLENNFPVALDPSRKAVTKTVAPIRAARALSLTGQARIEIRNGLVSRWIDLADYFDVPLADRSTFGQGPEPARKLLDWLEERRELNALRDAFSFFGMKDLIEVLDRHSPIQEGDTLPPVAAPGPDPGLRTVRVHGDLGESSRSEIEGCRETTVILPEPDLLTNEVAPQREDSDLSKASETRDKRSPVESGLTDLGAPNPEQVGWEQPRNRMVNVWLDGSGERLRTGEPYRVGVDAGSSPQSAEAPDPMGEPEWLGRDSLGLTILLSGPDIKADPPIRTATLHRRDGMKPVYFDVTFLRAGNAQFFVSLFLTRELFLLQRIRIALDDVVEAHLATT